MKIWAVLFATLLMASLAGCADDEPADTETGTNTGATGTETGGPDQGISEPEPVDFVVRTTGTYPVNPGFDKQTLQVIAGAQVNLTFYNDDQNPATVHDWVLDGVEGASTEAVGSGGSANVMFTAPSEPGEYAFFCSVGDHRDRGMEGTLVVV